MKQHSHSRVPQRTRRKARWFANAGIVAASLAGLLAPMPAAAGAQLTPADQESTSLDDSTLSAEDGVLTRSEQDALLGQDADAPNDRVWSLVGEADGLHVLTAVQSQGYAWERVAKFGTELESSERWIGNGCLASDGRTLAIVYAPIVYANDDQRFRTGARGAVVNLETSEIHDLGSGFTLSYFNPGCGRNQQVSFTSLGDDATDVTVIDAVQPTSQEDFQFTGQVTSVIPQETGVTAARGQTIVAMDASGRESTIETTDGQVFSLMPYGSEGLAFAVADAATSRAFVKTNASIEAKAQEIASGDLIGTQIIAGPDGEVLVAGSELTVESHTPDKARIVNMDATSRTYASSQAQLLLDPPQHAQPGVQTSSDQQDAPADITINVRATSTSVEHNFNLDETLLDLPLASTQGEARADTERSAVLESPCAVPRNDPSIQAYQPGLDEVEWAATRAVFGTLDAVDGAQHMFPLPSLVGGGRVPAQILLGILAQESNLWQASRYTTRGITGNPLIGDYYGTRSPDSVSWWDVNYEDADCGYGIAQVTDQMRAGAQSYERQLAIATDYRANIARGLQILIEKWNQTRDAGLIINNGDPQYLENWFYALWAYNTGFYPDKGTGAPWGVGWLNNPANAIYPPNRSPFLQLDPADAAHPQDWPYPEKVLGFAANPPWLLAYVTQDALGDNFEVAPSYEYAWWSTEQDRMNVKPPRSLFCDTSNNCNINSPVLVDGEQSPCAHQSSGIYDLMCWYHQPATWKQCDPHCGHENLSFLSSSPKPAAPPTSYHPVCDTVGLPTGALVVDSVPIGMQGSGNCSTDVANSGEFYFSFPGANGGDSAEVDLHQLGSGLNGSFYFTHARQPDLAVENPILEIEGTWRLDRPLNQWARVLVHMPDNGAWTQQAQYTVNTGSGVERRTLSQHNFANVWLDLGSFEFSGVPSLSLSSADVEYRDIADGQNIIATDASGADDIAWDAVAFVPLETKPRDFVVALGDSYSSGEGTSVPDGSTFYRSSDHGGGDSASLDRNACHRSPLAWSYNMTLPGDSLSIREQRESGGNAIDYHLLACSGAVVNNLLSSSNTDLPFSNNQGVAQYLERTQLDMGYLNSDTTIVTLTIGGNDIGFAQVISECVISGLLIAPCQPGLEQEVNTNISLLPDKVKGLLEDIHFLAPNAKILMQGYPSIFEPNGDCMNVYPSDSEWLKSVAKDLNGALTAAASSLPYVVYQNPQYQFAGRGLCTPNSAIQGKIWSHTRGDVSNAIGLPPSAQSVHPNPAGADLYADAASDALRYVQIPLVADITAGAPTTYYATGRYHSSSGSIAINVTSFDECGGELRVGMRVAGSGNTQATLGMGWTEPNALEHFWWDDVQTSTFNRWVIPPGNYSMNARLVNPCSGGGNQSWTAVLSW